MELTLEALRPEYKRLWDTMEIRPDRADEVSWAVGRIKRNRERYESLGLLPWEMVGVIHLMEAGLAFGCHIHNGDPLFRLEGGKPLMLPTVQVPKGRGPFHSWEASAADAISMKTESIPASVLMAILDREIPAWLWFLENYNGMGYRKYHPETLSPYLFSFTNHYTAGKYVADGKWSATAVSKQCGAAGVLKGLLAT